LFFKCQYQDIPDFENGYYLASYKCLCRVNHEFPFSDYGSSYFEGATVEKEYEKKLKGLPNVYDRLRCRPIMAKPAVRSTGSSYYWNSATSNYKTVNTLSTLILLKTCFLVNFVLFYF
jgi:hypothetical protein